MPRTQAPISTPRGVKRAMPCIGPPVTSLGWLLCRYVVNAAMSNDTGLIKFPRDCVDELCSLDDKKSQAHDFVHVSCTFWRWTQPG